MPRFRHSVTVPFAGTITATIESDKESITPEEIVQEVGQDIGRLTLKRIDPQREQSTDPELGEWELFDRIVQGNVCYVSRDIATVDDTEVIE